jgi:hypothetical protein
MNEEDFLLRDYELKVKYLTDHFQRMWTRFNFFVTIESALIGGRFIFGGEKNHILPLAFLGTVLSFIWYVFGAEDRFLVRVYRRQVEDAGKKVAIALAVEDPARHGYVHVGEIDETACELRQKDATKSLYRKLVERLSGWRFDLVSTTKLAALFPLFIFIAWLSVLTRLVWK